jgi:RNA polymerase sigma-70 factor (ECF subfamily)
LDELHSPVSQFAQGYATEEHSMSAVCFEDFVRQHSAPLLRTLTLVALDKEAAADAAQEAFIQLFKSWDQVRHFRAPVAWLYRVGINQCHDHRRRVMRRTRTTERLKDSIVHSGAVVEWAPEVEIMSLLRRLPSRQRTAAVLYYQADLPVVEIAEIMRISEGAVSSHLHKARKALQVLLEDS